MLIIRGYPKLVYTLRLQDRYLLKIEQFEQGQESDDRMDAVFKSTEKLIEASLPAGPHALQDVFLLILYRILILPDLVYSPGS